MLHIISYDLKKAELYEPLYAKLNELGDAYRCTESTFLLRSHLTAGGVDSEIRNLIDKDSVFVVMDITGITEEHYFGRVLPRAKGDSFWKWISDNSK